jgi:putative membrane protein
VADTAIDRMNNGRRGDGNAALGALAGFIGGAAGTWAMSQFQAMWSNAVDGFESPSAGGRHDARDWQERHEGQNANEIAAQAVATHTIDRPLSRDELEVAAPLMHYAFGSVMGAVYGALSERSRTVPIAAGAGFGTAVWLGADEIAMPMLGLARRDKEYPLEAHAQSLAAHIVYGVTTEIVRRALRGRRIKN